MQLSQLLRLQLFYALLGVLFNILSWQFMMNGNRPLTPTIPLVGIIVMMIYSLCILPGYFNKLRLYRGLMLVSIILLSYGGIIKHFIGLNQTPELYYSYLSGIIGVLINIFGFVLNLLAVLGKFR